MDTLQSYLSSSLPDVTIDNLVKMFLAGRSSGTMLAYVKDLEDLSRHLGVTPNDLPRTIISLGHGTANGIALQWRATMLESGLSSASINRKLSSLRSLISLARTLGLVSWTLEVKSLPSKSFRDTRGPGMQVVKGIIKNISEKTDSPRKRRDTAMLRLMWDHALRRNEIVSLDFRDVNLTETPTLSIMGKGRREREVLTLSPTAKAALREWIETRGTEEGPLFTSISISGGLGERLTGRGLAYIAGGWGRAVGQTVKCHGIRHTSISTALEIKNGNVSEVARFSRHADVRTVEIYNDNLSDCAGEISAKVGGLI